MYFLTKNTWLLSKYSSSSMILWYIGSLSLLVVSVMGWFFFVYRPLQESLVYYRRYEQPGLREDAIQYQVQKKLQHSIASLQESLQHNNVLAHGQPIMQILAWCHDQGLVVKRYTPGVLNDKTWYTKQTCTLECQGSFEQLVSLCSSLATMPITINKLLVTAVSETMLTVQLTYALLVAKDLHAAMASV